MKFSLYLGKYSGIKVFIHWTFSLLLLWIIISNMQSGAALADTGWTILFILSIFFCVILHEFGHALTAQKYGIQTKDIILLPIGGLARLEKLPEDPKQNFFLKGFLVSDALMRKFPIVAFDAPLKNAVDKLLDSQATHFVVVKEDEPIATLSREEIIMGLKEGNDQVSIQKAADPKPLRIDIDMPLEDALKKMASEKKKVALVYEGGQFLGLLDQENITEFIMVQNALNK